MKAIRYTVIAIAMFASCSSDKKETTTAENAVPATESAPAPVISGKYKIKSGTIHYEATAGDLKSKKIVYFDDYGAKERVETYDDDETLEGYNTSDGRTRYYIDIKKKTAWVADELGSRGWEMEFMTWEEIQRRGNEKNDFKRVDNVIVAGKDCEAYDFRGTAIFAGWKGITLYHKQKPNIVSQAVKLEENVDHDASVFAVPKGFEVKERPKYN